MASKGDFGASFRRSDQRCALHLDESERKNVRGCGNHVFLCLGAYGLSLFGQDHFGPSAKSISTERMPVARLGPWAGNVLRAQKVWF